MKKFDGLKRWLMVCWAGCLLMTGQVMAQTNRYEDWDKTKIEVAIKEAKISLSEVEQRLGAGTESLKRIQLESEKVISELAGREQKFAESGVAPQAYADVLILLQTIRVQLKIDLAGLQARQEFLRAIKPAESGKDREQLMFLQKKLLIAKRILEVSLAMSEKAEKSRASGIISLDELNKLKVESEIAAMKVVEIEAELAGRVAALEEANQPTLAAIQQTGLEIAEKEARLQQVEAQLRAIAEVGPELLQTEIKRKMLGKLEQERERLLAEVSEQELKKRWAVATLKELEEEFAKR
jgi:hypothetical protein